MAEDEDPEALKLKIDRLRQLVSAEDGLIVRMDDNFMLRYLRCCGYSPENAFNRMKSYYELKYLYPHWFATADTFQPLKDALSKNYFYILPTRDREGKCVYVNEIGQIKESNSSMSQQSQLHDFYIETLLDDEGNQLNGVCVIVDLKNISWRLLKWLTPGNLRIAVRKAEILPATKVVYHVVNPSVILNMALKIILPFLSSRTKENIYIHDDAWSSLHKVVDPKSLPTAYGGKLDADLCKIKINKTSEKLIVNLNSGYRNTPKTMSLHT